jgi:hypothetical protein
MKVEQYSSAPLEAGVYQLHLAEVDPNQTSTKEEPMILLKWEEGESKTQVWDRLVVSSAAAWKLAQLWVALGGSADDEVGDLSAFSSALVSKANEKGTVFAKVFIDEYQGKRRNKIQEYITDETGQILRDAQGKSPF